MADLPVVFPLIIQDFLCKEAYILEDERKNQQEFLAEGGSPVDKARLFLYGPVFNEDSRLMLDVATNLASFRAAVKVKLPVDNFLRLTSAGLAIDSRISAVVFARIYTVFDRDKKAKNGIWFSMYELLSIDGKDVNIQLVEPRKQKGIDAFAYAAKRSNPGLSSIEEQIETELSSYSYGGG